MSGVRGLWILALSGWTCVVVPECRGTETEEPATAAHRRAAWESLPEALQQAEAHRLAAIHGAVPATICVFSATDDSGGGSGVVVTPDGFAITNYHVTAPSGDYLRCGMPDGRLYDAVIVGIDPTGDVALIKLLGRDDFPTVPWGNSDRVRVGDACFAVGNPFALATDFQPSVTSGIISGVHRYQEPAGTLIEYTDCLQTDASINPGNSGGPLFNAAGELIGINGRCSFEKRGRVNVGVAYAISVNQVKRFFGHLRSGRIVDHATAGFTVSTSRDGSSTVVTNILRSSDAYRRGIRDGDTILSLDRRAVDSANAFKNVLGTLPKGWRVPVTVMQRDKLLETFVRLDGVHTQEELLRLVQPGGQRPPNTEEPGSEEPGSEDPQGDDAQPEVPDPGRRRGPRPRRARAEAPAQTMPPHVAQVYESRRGYANYAFNLAQRNLVLQRLRQFHRIELGDKSHPDQANTEAAAFPSDTRLRWTITGNHSLRGMVQIELDTDAATARFANGRVEQYQSPEATGLASDAATDPSHGFLTALLVTKRMLTEGVHRLGEVYYLGQSPLPQREDLFDVLVAIFETTETHFYCDTVTGQLVAVEMFPDIEVDPLEVLCFDEQALEAGMLPQRLQIQLGDDDLGTLDVTSWTSASIEQGERP